MRIEILNTGTELLLGSTLNTHGHWMGQELLKLGLRVQRQVTVPDGDAIRDAMAEAVMRCDALIVTGGLGPTSDDITREATAEVLGTEMIEDEQALRTMQQFFQARGYGEMPEGNRKQAQVPVGADVLPNGNGTAPGIYVPPRLGKASACAIFLLPGPPGELRPMFREEVSPRLVALAGIENAGEAVELKFVGIGESSFADGVDAGLQAIPGLEFGYCARPGELDLRLIGGPEAIAEARAHVAEHFPTQYVSDGDSLEQVVVRELTEAGLTLTTAESCTGGLVASRLTDIPGSSAVLTHGFVTYANAAKISLLGVRESALAAHGAVSEEVCREMAEGALAASGADLAISVTGIAGPDGGSDGKPVGTVYLGLAQKGRETAVQRRNHPRGRRQFKDEVSQRALDMIRRRVVHGE
ncbi:competence/damage-inducible protein A [Roseibacillus ishigakijimensis]|uniref:CinA-like protein n=1 Tax=Roseibacillus ishigakijimensis TaxID=454146 RepID=A0A934VP27_9BACT|nr:competence/damage-inducible protein A [Roseibacillus ishigakijimensis]MBK1835655.1 competence/damage-inducible protein A [Roseibacillus ishigakijimensis]